MRVRLVAVVAAVLACLTCELMAQAPPLASPPVTYSDHLSRSISGVYRLTFVVYDKTPAKRLLYSQTLPARVTRGVFHVNLPGLRSKLSSKLLTAPLAVEVRHGKRRLLARDNVVFSGGRPKEQLAGITAAKVTLPTDLPFNGVEVAKVESSIAGVMAGFALTVVVLLLGRIGGSAGISLESPSYEERVCLDAIAVFVVALLTSTLSSFLYAVAGGEYNAVRSLVLVLPPAFLLCIAVILLVYGLYLVVFAHKLEYIMGTMKLSLTLTVGLCFTFLTFAAGCVTATLIGYRGDALRSLGPVQWVVLLGIPAVVTTVHHLLKRRNCKPTVAIQCAARWCLVAFVSAALPALLKDVVPAAFGWVIPSMYSWALAVICSIILMSVPTDMSGRYGVAREKTSGRNEAQGAVEL